jgi:LmbE family N-acetylglucosaminyl deacetylase
VRRAVIVAPHPDDEIIGAAGLIQRLRAHGARVTVVVVSDGAASHPASRRWPRRRRVAARRRESLTALRRLGIMTGEVAFLGLPDGALHGAMAAGSRQLARIVARRRADMIVGPVIGDAHPDHQAVAAMLDAVPGPALRLGYQVWPPRAVAGRRARRVVVRGGHATKRSLIRVHRTQLGAIHDDPEGFTMAPHELRIFARPIETYVVVRR